MSPDDDGFDVSRAELFEALGHQTRIRLLQALAENPMGFSDLKRRVDIDSSGLLSFHLGKLTHLVTLTQDGRYSLTDEGKEAIRMVEITKGQGHPQTIKVRNRSPKTYVAIIAILLVALVALGSVSLYQQGQLQSMTVRSQGDSPGPNALVYGTVILNVAWASGIQGSFHVTEVSFYSSGNGQEYYSVPNVAGGYWVSLPSGQTYIVGVSYKGNGTCGQSCASIVASWSISSFDVTLTAATGPTQTETCAPSGCFGTGSTQIIGDLVFGVGTCSGKLLILVSGSSSVNYNPVC